MVAGRMSLSNKRKKKNLAAYKPLALSEGARRELNNSRLWHTFSLSLPPSKLVWDSLDSPEVERSVSQHMWTKLPTPCLRHLTSKALVPLSFSYLIRNYSGALVQRCQPQNQYVTKAPGSPVQYMNKAGHSPTHTHIPVKVLEAPEQQMHVGNSQVYSSEVHEGQGAREETCRPAAAGTEACKGAGESTSISDTSIDEFDVICVDISLSDLEESSDEDDKLFPEVKLTSKRRADECCTQRCPVCDAAIPLGGSMEDHLSGCVSFDDQDIIVLD